MKIAFVNPPRTNFDCEELAPPLGLIRLAQVALRCGWLGIIEDYNLLWHLDAGMRAAFYETALERLLNLDARIYGFTSMAVDSHIALELSRRLKRARPDCKVILGGPHFSAIADHVIGLYPWVDGVLRGEAEEALAELLKPGTQLDSQDLQLSIEQWNELHLQAYFHVNPRRMVNLETSRGCIFKCAFCYSPGHYSSVRNFATQGVLEQMRLLPDAGVRHAWFVDDNFLNNPVRANELCQALGLLEKRVTWSCYATFPQLSEDVIEMMSHAGCTEVFCGIDAVGSAAERAFQKAFLRGTDPITTKIGQLTNAGIKPTFAFMVAPPSHPAGAGYNDAVTAALDAQAAGANILLNPLSLYSGTVAFSKAASRFEPDCLQAQMMMDLPELAMSNPFAQHHAELFPFHSRYVEEGEWRSFLSVTRIVSTLIHSYPRTLLTLQKNTGIMATEVARRVLERFEDWTAVPREVVRNVERDMGFVVLDELFANSGARGPLYAEYHSRTVPDDCKMEM